MSSPREQTPPRRKRQRTEAGSLDDHPSESQPSKRLKISIKLHSAAFYDSLSKVWLTRRALKELDRRTSQANSPQRPASTSQRLSRNTLKKIQRFARDGGPELRDLRGYPAPRNGTRTISSISINSSGSKRTKSTVLTSASSKSKRSSAYDKDFEQHLTDNHIYIRNRKSKPGGLEGLQQRLSQARPSLSPSRFSDNAFESFQQKNEDVIDEGDVMRDVVPILCGDADIPSRQNLLFSRLEPIANDTTVDAKPGFYDGARLEDVNKRVREDIGDYIIPTGHSMAPVAPHFFLEAKRPSGEADVAKRQACYNGALGARAMHKLQSYGQDEQVYDGNAYTITSTYHAGTLRMYTTHVTSSSSGGSPEYHMSQVGGWDALGDPDTCRRGFTAFRNGRDWAQEQRDAFISAANERARSRNAELSPPESFNHNNVPEEQDSTCPTQTEDPDGDPQYYMSQQVSQEGYMNNESLDFASNYDGFSDTTEVQRVKQSEFSTAHNGAGYIHTDWPTSESSDYNGPSETTDAYPAQESETSPDELALDTYSTPATSNKRRNRGREKTVSKAPRHSDGGSGRKYRSRR